jgi:hypothetical protein
MNISKLFLPVELVIPGGVVPEPVEVITWPGQRCFKVIPRKPI